MFDSFRNRVAAARESDQLFFAALLPTEHIESKFGEASAILDSARVYTTAVTLWTYLTQVLSSDHGCVSAVCWEEPVLGTACAGDSLCWGQPVLGTELVVPGSLCWGQSCLVPGGCLVGNAVADLWRVKTGVL